MKGSASKHLNLIAGAFARPCYQRLNEIRVISIFKRDENNRELLVVNSSHIFFDGAIINMYKYGNILANI